MAGADSRATKSLWRLLKGSQQSVPPKAFKPIGSERCVAHCRIDRLVTKVVLDRPRVLTVIGKLVPARMAQHVAVHEEREAGGLSSSRNHALIASHADRR